MSFAVHLLGRPRVERDGEQLPSPRGRKAWALLAYMLLSRVRTPPREHLAELLFPGADDPLGAVRWNLAEIRRLLGASVLPQGSTELALPPDTFLDVEALVRGTPQEAISIPGLGHELLEAMDFGASPGFEAWLLNERRRLLGAAEAALHDAALDRLAAGDAAAAVPLATRLVEMNPYDENFQELLVRSYAEAGDREGARRQLSGCVELFRAELGREPGPAVFRATEATAPSRRPSIGRAGRATAQARIETGRSAVNAGSFEAGVRALARATAEANACEDRKLEADAWLALGTALVHSARGRDEEGADALLRAAALAEADRLGDVAAAAHRELAYTDILQARYARCARRLDRAAAFAESEEELAGVEAMHGLAAADTGAHDRALVRLQRSVELAERAGSRQQAAFSLSFVGRSRFLREELTDARSALERSLAIAREAKWVAFEPWPESWLAEAELAAGEIPAGRDRFEHAWALASELGDPCWEGTAGQGLGRIACLEGEVAGGLRMLEEARRVAGSYPDAYVWVEAYALAELASAAVEAEDRRARRWIEDLSSLAARTGMRELAVRAWLLRASLGDPGSLESAAVLAAEVENPAMRVRVQERATVPT
jgi:DNA-binding SARP family transcriptional activator